MSASIQSSLGQAHILYAAPPRTTAQPAAVPQLGAAEACLRRCQGVDDAVLAPQADPAHGLVAYLVPRRGAVLGLAEVHAAASAGLAPALVPRAYVELDGLPRRADGTLDRDALPPADPTRLGRRCYRVPLGQTETALAALWRKLLGLGHVGRDESFFDLGGHSALGVQLIYEVRQMLDIEATIRDLAQAPTLAGFAAAVQARIDAGSRGGIIAVRPEGRLRPLFLIHSGDGEIGYAHELVPWLDPELPVYGLAPHGLRSGEQPLASVEEMAASYVAAIRMVQAAGPYRVAGWGSGGVLAYEVAQQLLGADQAVELLGMIDTPGRHPWPASAPGEAGLEAVPASFDAWLAGLSWLPSGVSAPMRAQLQVAGASAGTDVLLLRCQQAGVLEQGLEPDQLRRRMALRHTIARAVSHYVRAPLGMAATLFASAGADAAALGWQGPAAQAMRVRSLQVPRCALMEPPHVERLGAVLDQALRESASAPQAIEELRYTPRITIHAGRGARPLFCVPGAGASVTGFAMLSAALDPAIPLHGLQPRGLCGRLAPHADVGSAARHYVEAVRKTQPHGPYRLLGHSYGGWVAFEMARQLDAAGEHVAGLFVLDSEAPGAAVAHAGRANMLARLVEIYQMGSARPIGLAEADFVLLDHEAQLALLLRRLVEAGVLPARTPQQMLAGIVRVFAANLNTAYQPRGAYRGTLELVAVPDPGHDARRPFDTAGLLNGWRACAPAARLWQGPGNHITLLADPHVRTLAAYLHPLLEKSA